MSKSDFSLPSRTPFTSLNKKESGGTDKFATAYYTGCGRKYSTTLKSNKNKTLWDIVKHFFYCIKEHKMEF